MEAITREEKLMDGQTLEPITRKEKILAGEDLDPITREEWFLKEYRGGGGGDITVESLNVTENGTYTAPTGKAYTPVKVELPLDSKTITENGTYTASDDNLAGFDEVTVAVEGYAKKSIANTPTPIATFNASALPMPSLTVGIEAQQAGAGDPSPQNIRPITGFSAVNRYRTGINIWDEEYEGGGYDVNTGAKVSSGAFIRNKNKIIVKDNLNYYVKYGTTSIAYVLCYDANNSYLGLARRVDNNSTNTANSTIKLVSGTKYINFYSSTYGTTYNNDISINYPSTDTEYHAYSGTTYTTTLKDGQGNPLVCYGGELVNQNGVQSLTDEWVYLTIDSVDEFLQADSSSRRYFSKTIGAYDSIVNGQIVCDSYKTTIVNTTTSTVGINVINSSAYNDARINIRPSNVSSYTLNSFNAELAENPIHVIYKVTNPQQIPQDSLAISSSAGVNNIWADSGDVLSGEYMEAL